MKTNKIYCENCFATMGRMPDNTVDIVFTSPPYNRKRNDKYKYYDDNMVDYYVFLKKFVSESMRVCKGNVFVNIQKNYYNKKDVFKLIGEFSECICEVFIWEKSNPMPANGFNITNAYEFIIVFGEKLKSNKTYTKNHLTTSVARMSKDHKAVMNKKIAKFFVKNFTQENEIIYDPFMGLGTTAIVAKEQNRKYIGSEISKEYCEIAEQRLKQEVLF